jgi:FMN phosphatase YigB (HAD superfamily)
MVATGSGNGRVTPRIRTCCRIVEWDVAGPQRLGLRGIWVDVQGQGLPAASPVVPDRIIRAFPEIVDG